MPTSLPAAQAQVSDMFAQSAAVLASPSARTFERFEKRGGLPQALLYVLLAALVSALVAALFAPLHADVTVVGQFVSRLIGIPAQFFLFTGLVYLIGRQFRGTGTYPEVAYSFALFFVPLSIIISLLGVVPLLGALVKGVVWLVMAGLGYLAARSSMNLRNANQAALTLLLSGIASYVFALLLLN